MKRKKTTLLIVEDNEDERYFLEHAFKAIGSDYRVQALCSGDEALAYLQGEGKYADRTQYEFPSYMITDLDMPNGDGFLILDFIKLHPALSVIPVVMISSSEHPDDIRTAYFLGASSYFVKPTDLLKFRALVKRIHEYWLACEVPEVDESGFALATNSVGRPGARYPKPAGH